MLQCSDDRAAHSSLYVLVNTVSHSALSLFLMANVLVAPHPSSAPLLLQKSSSSNEIRRSRRLAPTDASYPRTHNQALERFRFHWQTRNYAAAADYAALAHTLAVEAGDVQLANKFVQARQLAHKYQALRVEMQHKEWSIGVDPILEPDDPPTSETRCNMLCTPDRPGDLTNWDVLEQQEYECFQGGELDVVSRFSTSIHMKLSIPTTGSEKSTATSTQCVDESLPANFELEKGGVLCCIPHIVWTSWRRNR